MQVLKDFESLQTWRDPISDSVGFVPTMGALHAGHMSLVARAKQDNAQVVVSVFVNPTQFDQAKDLEKYPNTLAQDLDALANAGVAAVYLPQFDDMYPDDYRYQVTENTLSRRFCGAHRPGHFDGVLSVVMKLFNQVQPSRAYFGEKDYQQLHLIKDMVEAFFMPVEIVPCAIVREADGLAMSSRNLRLTPEQRTLAPKLHETLVKTGSLSDKKQALTGFGFEVDYLDVLDDRLLVAASLGEIRLIDNVRWAGE